jgi:uncharacterized protein YaaQ
VKLLVSVLDHRAARRVADALVERRYGVTRIDTVGGFLKRGNATLLVGVEDADVDDALAVMRAAHGTMPTDGSPGSSGPVFVLGVAGTARM